MRKGAGTKFDWSSVVHEDYAKTFDPTISNVDSMQVGGNHYVGRDMQPWDYIVSNNLGYLEGNIIKYVSRYDKKGGLVDLQKAKHYLDKLIEVKYERVQKVTTS